MISGAGIAIPDPDHNTEVMLMKRNHSKSKDEIQAEELARLNNVEVTSILTLALTLTPTLIIFLSARDDPIIT